MSSEVVSFLVIIPTFRRPGPLHKALKSAFNQAGISTQIIVADDCPDGSAAEVARSFPGIIYLNNLKPSGGWPGRVRNFAFDRSREMGIKAEFVHFLDDDDTVPVGNYAFLKENFDLHPELGVIFGVMRPFCEFSDNPAQRQRQELQLDEVRNWRVKATRYPWCYQQVGAALRLPSVTQWFLRQHAIFGAEMFLCSGGAIRYEHVVELGGFPDIRITQDYFFYTDAIRRYGALFVKKETAGYGVGDPGAIWNPLDLDGAAKVAHTDEWMKELRGRQKILRAEMGYPEFYTRKSIYRIGELVLKLGVLPVLDRWGYFAELHQLTKPDYRRRRL